MTYTLHDALMDIEALRISEHSRHRFHLSQLAELEERIQRGIEKEFLEWAFGDAIDEDLKPQGPGHKIEDYALWFNLSFTARGVWGSHTLPFRENYDLSDWVL